jgi:hypothetical protein
VIPVAPVIVAPAQFPAGVTQAIPASRPATNYGMPGTSAPDETMGAPGLWNASAATPGLAAPAPATTRVHAKGGSAAGLGTTAILVILVGAWGAIVPFVGAKIHLAADGLPAWHWNLEHGVLWVAPGALALLLGIVMLREVPRVKAKDARFGSAWTGFLTVVCGAWFVVGPFAWPVLRSGAVVFVGAPSAARDLLYLVAWSLGPGTVLVLLGGCAIGFSLRRSS